MSALALGVAARHRARRKPIALPGRYIDHPMKRQRKGEGTRSDRDGLGGCGKEGGHLGKNKSLGAFSKRQCPIREGAQPGGSSECRKRTLFSHKEEATHKRPWATAVFLQISRKKTTGMRKESGRRAEARPPAIDNGRYDWRKNVSLERPAHSSRDFRRKYLMGREAMPWTKCAKESLKTKKRPLSKKKASRSTGGMD